MSRTDEVKVPGVVNSLFLTLGSLFTKLGQGDLAFIKSVAGRLERIHKPDSLLEAPIRLSHKIGGNAVPWGAYDADGVFHYVFENGPFTTIRRMSAYADGYEDITPEGLEIVEIYKFMRTCRGDIAYVAELRGESDAPRFVAVWGDIVCLLERGFDIRFDKVVFGQTAQGRQIAYSYHLFPRKSADKSVLVHDYPDEQGGVQDPVQISFLENLSAVDDRLCVVTRNDYQDGTVVHWCGGVHVLGKRIYVFADEMIVHDGCLQLIIEEDDGAGYKTYKRVTISPEGTMKVEGFSAGLDPGFYRTEDRIFVVNKQRVRYVFTAVDLLIKRDLPEREIWQKMIGKKITFVSTPEYVYVLHEAGSSGMRMGAPLPVVSQHKNTDSLEPVGSAQVSVNEVELHECAGVVFISFKGSKQRSQFIQHVDEVLKKPAKERLSPFEMFGSVCDLTVVNGRSDLLGYHFREGTLFLTGINL